MTEVIAMISEEDLYKACTHVRVSQHREKHVNTHRYTEPLTLVMQDGLSGDASIH